MQPHPLAEGIIGRPERRRMIAMPRIELPAGIEHATVLPGDREWAEQAERTGDAILLRRARDLLRDARRAQRRAGARPAAKARKRAGDLQTADDRLLAAGLACGVLELHRAGLTALPERIARIRERCQERLSEERGRYAVDVENWIRDLAGEPRLTRG